MKFSKRQQSSLVVEEEIYNWAPNKRSTNRRLVYISVLMVAVAVLFNTLN